MLFLFPKLKMLVIACWVIFIFLTWANWYFMAYLVHGHGDYRVIGRINIRIRDRDLSRFV